MLNSHIVVFYIMTVYSGAWISTFWRNILLKVQCSLQCVDGDCTFLQNTGTPLPDYMVSYPSVPKLLAMVWLF